MIITYLQGDCYCTCTCCLCPNPLEQTVVAVHAMKSTWWLFIDTIMRSWCPIYVKLTWSYAIGKYWFSLRITSCLELLHNAEASSTIHAQCYKYIRSFEWYCKLSVENIYGFSLFKQQHSLMRKQVLRCLMMCQSICIRIVVAINSTSMEWHVQ